VDPLAAADGERGRMPANIVSDGVGERECFLTDLLGEGEGGLATLPNDSVSSRHR
jgi:hypothetical protein